MSSYGSDGPIWTVPEVGCRDAVGRLKVVEDANSDTTSMTYDVDGRCTQIDHNNGLSDLMSFDIVGKLLSKRVEGSETLMEMRYGYSLAGDPIAQQTDLDTFTYLTDAAGRLVEESHNRFCIHQAAIWKQGQWNRLFFDESAQTMQLLPFADNFSGSQGLRLGYPRALHNQTYLHRVWSSLPPFPWIRRRTRTDSTVSISSEASIPTSSSPAIVSSHSIRAI